MNTLLVIDGNAIMHRAYHAIPPFKTVNGTPTNMVFGFMSMLYKSIQDFKPDHLIICFDTPKQTFRNKLSPEYQAHRPKMEDDFISQIHLVRELIDKAGFLRLEKDGYEADDVIGTVARHCDSNTKVLILTGDKDIFQLINNHTFVIAPKFGFSDTILYDSEGVIKKMGVEPKLIPDYKALVGDPSDNYKGAKGIGPQGAANLLRQFGSVDDLLKRSDEITNERVKNIIKSNTDQIELSHTLATIKTDLDLNIDMKKAQFKGFNTDLEEFLKRMEINSLRHRMYGKQEADAKQKTVISKKPKQSSDQIKLF